MILALPVVALLQAASPADSLLEWMDRIAQKQLAERRAAIRKITTRAQAEARQKEVREKLLRAMGGLPSERAPLDAKVTGTLRAPGYRVEKVYFQSFPRYLVTANLYVPDGNGPFPGVLFAMGHWDEGKVAAQQMAANLARKGFVVLAYDPVGQGERLQAYDARTKRSLAGGSTEQHFLNGAQSLLVGQSFARYRIWDGIRALDYLAGRPEVDAQRIGCTGCSGGGTLTTYLSALDDRIKVAAPACYTNSFQVLFRGPVGDSEQSLPGFLSEGLDLPDWIELAAPKPYLIGSTREDFFPLEGARIAFEEARGWYELFGVQDRIRWVVGPGPHGTPREVREGVYEWMIRHLKDGKGSAAEEDLALIPDMLLRVTETGNVSPELGSGDLVEIISESATRRKRLGSIEGLRSEIQRISTETEPALPLKSEWLEPASPARGTAVLFVETARQSSPLARRMAARGHPVLVVWPSGLPLETPTSQLSGDWLTNTRAWLIGRNLVGLRVRDIRAGVAELAAKAASKTIHGYGEGVAGLWLLMAAAIEPRIAGVWLDRTPATLWDGVSQPLSRDLHDAVIPGFALRWDFRQLREAVAPRPVLWSDPTDWMRNVIPLAGAYRYRWFEQPDELLIAEALDH
jgi:hypothetical protein